MSDWTSEPHPDDLLDGLPGEARQELDQIAHEITVRDSMVYLDGKGYDGPTPGLRTEARGRLMVTYLTDVRGERVVILHVAWFGLSPAIRLASGTWVQAYGRCMTTDNDDAAWVPDACTLPSAERPRRRAEFDDLLAVALRGQERLSSTRLRWRLDPSAEQTARDLTSGEAECCSFFSFTFAPAGDTVHLDIAVPEAHAGVLDALADRAAASTGR